MQSKQIILVAIIVVALGVAGLFAYKAFFGSGSSSAIINEVDTSNQSVSGAILPYGTDLDFDTVKKFNKNGKLFPYPTVTPTDVGQELNTLVNQ